MATVASSRPVSQIASAADAAPALWAALGYISGKEADRDALADGSLTTIDLTIAGSIDGLPVAERITGRLTVGHQTEKASSSTPNVSHIIGALLAKLNKATRAKVLAEIPAEYAAGGQALPELSVGDVADAENLLAALRQTKRVVARGPVKCEYSLIGVDSDASPAVAGFIGR